MYDIIIIGAGPAGLTAALNCQRAGKKTLILEGESIGGQIAYSPLVANFPTYLQIAGSELVDKLYDQVDKLGASLEVENAIQIAKTAQGFTVVTNYNKYDCKSVIIATGVKHKTIGLPREDELVGKGVSYCAICDGAFYSGQEVAMIGDGNTALQYSLLLSNYCKKVHICTLFDKFFGDKQLIDSVLKQPNVTVYHNLALKQFVGANEVEGLIFNNTTNNSTFQLAVKAAFICIGQVANNEAFAGVVELDKSGYIVAGEDCKTSCEGIFAVGDCRTKQVRQLITAAADGSIAAFNACQYVDVE